MNLFNAMIKYSHIPQIMKTDTTITLFKGGNKRKYDPNSYRAISSAVLLLFFFFCTGESSKVLILPLICYRVADKRIWGEI